MQIASHRFDRMEFAGSLGDLGTLIPLSVALVTLNGLSFTTVFLIVGLFYVSIGFYYRLPIPVQPLKVVAAIAIVSPEKITLPIMAATGIIFGIFLLVLAFTGIIDWLSKLFTKPIVRGIQLGLGFILMMKGITFIGKPELFLHKSVEGAFVGDVPVNLIIGIISVIVVLFLLSSRRFPAALVVLGLGIAVGIPFGSFGEAEWIIGPTRVELFAPGLNDCIAAIFLLVIPQIPLTIGNAIIGSTDAAKSLFGTGEVTRRATNRNFSISMGMVNLAAGAVAGMPLCHGAGGLAAHYRFGARTGGSNIMIGILFVILALVFGKIGIFLLTSIPNAVLGVLLLFAGLELAVLVRDVDDKKDLFVAFLIAGIALATTNMGIAFFAGIILASLIKAGRVEI